MQISLRISDSFPKVSLKKDCTVLCERANNDKLIVSINFPLQEKKLYEIKMLVSLAVQSPVPKKAIDVNLSDRLQKNCRFLLRAIMTLILG